MTNGEQNEELKLTISDHQERTSLTKKIQDKFP